jgi:hypothetical protein
VIGPPGPAEPCQNSSIDTFDFIPANFNAVLKLKVVTAAKFGGRVALSDLQGRVWHVEDLCN